MTPEEITKLAEEYVTDVYNGDTDFINEAKNIISWLLRTHCIVSKEEVRKMHDNELEFAQFYQRKADSCINPRCRIDYEISRDIAKSRANLLESLFDAETFKNSEV